MKRTLAAAAIALLALTGCSSATERQPGTTEEANAPTPSTERDPNESACANFEINYNAIMVDMIKGAGERTPEVWRQELADKAGSFDSISLSANGEVADRIDAVATGFPNEPYTILLSDHRDQYKQYGENTQRVARACAAAGHDIDIATIKFGF